MVEEYSPLKDDMLNLNHGSDGGIITLPGIVKCIIDTAEFQRLRYIKQLGIAHLVFPNADHSRYVHSIGTAGLAYQLMTELARRYPENVSGNDILAVTIAALCHDLGHGPFSHLFEKVYDQQERHEVLSVKMFEKILEDYPAVKAKLARHFDDTYFQLVTQLIDPPDFSKDWTLVIPKEKAFVFSVVSNNLSGLDVDKLDYLIRDSRRAGIAVAINRDVVDLLFKSATINTQNNDHIWIGFGEKYHESVKNIFESRKQLHAQLYNHRVVVAASENLGRALRCAGDYLEIPGTNNNRVLLKDCSKDLVAFMKLNDSVIDLIKASFSTEPKMLEAKQLIKQIELRQFSRIIAKIDYMSPQPPEFEGNIRRYLLNSKIINDADLIVVLKDFHCGKGQQDPLENVIFNSKSKEIIFHKQISESCRSCLFVFGSYGCSDDVVKKVCNALTGYVAALNIFRENEFVLSKF